MIRYTHADGRTAIGDNPYEAITAAIGRDEAHGLGWPELFWVRAPGDTCLQRAALMVDGIQIGEYMQFTPGESS